jgi:hypothetical protein
MDGNHLVALIFTLGTTRQAGGIRLLRYSGRSIVHYSFALKCLADESLRLIQNSGIILEETMEERVLSVAENQFAEIPTDLWKEHVRQRAKEIPKVLGFMTEDHHRVRYFVVRELPRLAKPIPPERIADEFELSLSETTAILDDLEQNLFFLVRNDKGEVLWAFPVTADQTPHRMTFSNGENINAA